MLTNGSTFKFVPYGSVCKESVCNAGDTGGMGLIPGSRKSPGGGNGSPLPCPCLENSMDGEALWATVYRVTKSQMQQKRRSTA